MRFTRNLPIGLYNSLPFLYAGTGILITAVLQSLWGLLSGVALVAAGILIWRTRRTYRRAALDRLMLSTRGGDPLPGKSGNGLAQLVWGKECECGIPSIDTQHRRLFKMAVALQRAIVDQQLKLDVELLLDELIQEVSKHFVAEEADLVDAGYPLTPHQKMVRQQMLERCQEMVAGYHGDVVKPADLSRFVVRELIAGHITSEHIKAFSSP